MEPNELTVKCRRLYHRSAGGR